ncbi:PREDICTED: probable E3 ubiquitin-protein ligase makorin-2 [Chrysochloris asiatica]|uniref:E3 ubiquitin-protein ligase makorin-2 n=1 Tax=Chrysochloris asiatica TaxID=185453 RepID=A0A9B0TXQ1_CHRAS|nr:PREDICTED: probable E3 ubiquitin-protein ligase makorin-2 [Chrysochloris asiatica]
MSTLDLGGWSAPPGGRLGRRGGCVAVCGGRSGGTPHKASAGVYTASVVVLWAGMEEERVRQSRAAYFMHGVCREGNQCLFSHDLANSKPSTICKYYQKGYCAYGTRCRYDHTRPSAAAGGVVGALPPAVPSLGFHSPQPPECAASAPKVNLQEPGKREKRALVLRDRNLCGLAEDKSHLCVVSNSEGCSDLRTQSMEMKPHSYLEAIRSGLDDIEAGSSYSDEQQLCPYAAAGECHFGDDCVYLHGELCEICRLQVLHPSDPEQRRTHEKICMATFEHEMEKAFALQASQDKVCSICMEVVLEKASASERRFGILSNCNHTYCLSCIRQWRCAKQFENPIIKSCPECRVISEFVIPSVYWVEDQNKKNELIEAFKQGMGKKACKYFEQGKGTCPFGSKCLYRHAYPDGRLAEPEKPRKQLSSEGTVRFFNSVRLWDFIENRESQHIPNPEDVDMTELGDLFMHLSGVESSEP